MRFLSALLVALALCAVSTRAEESDAVLDKAIADAVRSVMATKTNIAGAAATTFTGMQSGLSTLHSTLTSAYANAGAQAEAAVAAFEAQYCSPPVFTPGKKVPATFTGHSMEITFSLGGCTFNETQWLEDGEKVLNCTEPSITYTKSPANFTSKYHKAPTFTSKECKVTKTFGEEVEKVLFVFDGQQAPDMNSLIAKITEEVKGVLSTVGSGAQNLYNNARATAGGMWGNPANPSVPNFQFS